MHLSNALTRAIAELLTLAVLFQLIVTANPLTRSLSLGSSTRGNLENERFRDPLNYADNSLITRQGKANKVSQLMRLIHEKAGEQLYARRAGQRPNDNLMVRGIGDDSEQLRLNQMPADEIILSACSGQAGRTCQLAARLALSSPPEEKAIIANSIRNRPPHVDASRLLYYKLFESAISKTEKNKYDEKINFGIDLFVRKNPYALAATKAIDMAMKAKNSKNT